MPDAKKTKKKAESYTCTVKYNKWITPTVFSLGFETDQPLSFLAGQFISIIIPGAGPKGRDLRRAYSIASGPEEKTIELCIKLVEGGPGTQYLRGLETGQTFRGMAPYGDFTYRTDAGRRVLFIATGTGIAPHRSMIYAPEYLNHKPSHAECLFGVRHNEELFYEKEFKHAGVQWITA